MAECRIGSVVSTCDARLGAWAAEQKLEALFRIFLPSFLEGMAEKARELGYGGAKSHSPAVGMVLAEGLRLPTLDHGFKLAELSLARIDELRGTGDFGNALGEVDEHDKLARFKRAMAIFTAEGGVAAASGVWEQYPGIRDRRRCGTAVSRPRPGGAPDDRGDALDSRCRPLPIYTFGFSNLRSQNNGLRCGYRPLWVLSVVYVLETKEPTGGR